MFLVSVSYDFNYIVIC